MRCPCRGRWPPLPVPGEKGLGSPKGLDRRGLLQAAPPDRLQEMSGCGGAGTRVSAPGTKQRLTSGPRSTLQFRSSRTVGPGGSEQVLGVRGPQCWAAPRRGPQREPPAAPHPWGPCGLSTSCPWGSPPGEAYPAHPPGPWRLMGGSCWLSPAPCPDQSRRKLQDIRAGGGRTQGRTSRW